MSTPRAVLVVIDGCNPAMLEEAIAAGRAPFLARVAERGSGVRRLAAAFPSVTPICATAIATGALQDRHHIPGMNWWSRDESRYVEYGSSLRAARRHGITRQLTDTVYRLNGEHLSEGVRTVFETLDDADVRTAGTTFLVYRGRHEHEVSRASGGLARVARTMFRTPVRGPRELFYADLFASRETSCRSQLGKPGVRDQHAGCVSAYLAARDLYDFLLLSLPDNDTLSHRFGPERQPEAIALADAQLTRVAEAAGGVDRFFERHAIVVCSDHAHTSVRRRVDLHAGFAGWPMAVPTGPAVEVRRRARVRPPADASPEIALCPNQRGAMLYVLKHEARASILDGLVSTAEQIEGVDLLCWREGDRAIVRAPGRGELWFGPSPAGQDADVVRDDRGRRWAVGGDLDVLAAAIDEGVLRSHEYPDALRRIWASLSCPTSGDLILSAAPGCEFVDWGGVDHVGAGSHGSLHRSDSLGTLLWSGCELPPPGPEAQPDFTPSISDVASIIYRHFDLG